MTNEKKVVLISRYPIPFEDVGSWVRRIEYLINSKKNCFDFIICPKLKNHNHIIENVNYLFVKPYNNVFLKKFNEKARFYSYFLQIKDLLKKFKFLSIVIFDNYKILYSLNYYLQKYKLRNRVKIIFNICGFSYFFDNEFGENFYNSIDEMIYLTYSSYKFEMSRYHSITPKCNILYNPINKSIFNFGEEGEKNELRTKFKIKPNEIIFFWNGRDRKKKGLDIILEAWDIVSNKYNNLKLIVSGSERIIKNRSIINIGINTSQDISKVLKISDCFLFSTLCHEGFPLSLIEAIASHAYPIASNIDPVQEIINYFNFGELVNFPNSPDSWVNSIINFIRNSHDIKFHKYDLILDIDQWCDKFIQIIKD